MALGPDQALRRAKDLAALRAQELLRLDEVRRYWTGRQALPVVIPAAAAPEVRVLARMARVNVVGIVVESLAQSLAVEGFHAKLEERDADVWGIWQANRMDARQSVIHRAVLAYGVAYGVVTPGDPVPVVRGLSPRKITARYPGDSDWPEDALELRPDGTWRLYEPELVHTITGSGGEPKLWVSSAAHGAGHVPVVRYLEVQDPDWDDEPADMSQAGQYALNRQVIGQVAPLMTVQDQVDLITFNLQVAQHYAAFRQRFVIGWAAPDEATRVKMSASTIWTFEDGPDQVKVGDLESTSMDGYLSSRESSFKQAAALSQTPAHELIGDLVNLSAEALAAAEAGRDRKVADRQTSIGESHEQLLGLAGRLAGVDVPRDAQVVWRDTSARSFAATVDGLGKLATLLGIPVEELWARIPGVSQQDVDRWRAMRAGRAGQSTPPAAGTAAA